MTSNETRTDVDGWTVRPHGPLSEVDDGIAIVDGTLGSPIGTMPRRMSVVTLEGGRLLIYSAICLDEAGMRALEARGTPAFLVVPNEHHRMDALAWKRRYPSLVVVAPAGAREKVEDKVPVDTSHPALADPAVTLTPVYGTREHEVAVEVKRTAGTTLIVNDVIANIRDVHGLKAWLLRLMGMGVDGPDVPATTSLLLVKEKAALRQQLLDWSDLPGLRRIIVSHGEPISDDAPDALRKLAASID